MEEIEKAQSNSEAQQSGSATSSGVDKEVTTFISQIESLSTALPFVTVTMYAVMGSANEKFNKFLEANGELNEQAEGKKIYTLPIECVAEADKLERDSRNTRVGSQILPRHFIVSLVSQYDAYLGRLLRSFFYLQPGLLNSSEQKLSFAQLVELGSIDSAREYLIEKEAEKVLRMSHSEQFIWLENKFSVPLRKELSIWPIFIELTERRNLFVHCDGIVSSQYLAVCNEHGVKFKDGGPKVGDQLGATQKYFERAYRCILEIGVKLSQVLWRKLSKGDASAPDSNLIDITFGLVVTEQYGLALALLEFGCDVIKNHSSEMNRRILIINRAQAYKWFGKPEKCSEILKGEDWSACGNRFQLAVMVLNDDFKMAAELMEKIGADGDIRESDYKDWPLFKEFRKSGEFLKAFEQIYGKPFTKTQMASTNEQPELNSSEDNKQVDSDGATREGTRC